MSSGCVSGKKAVATAGTSVALPSQGGLSVVVKALSTNTGLIYVKPGGVAGTDYRMSVAEPGFELKASEAVTIPLRSGNISEIIIDASVGTDSVSWITSSLPILSY